MPSKWTDSQRALTARNLRIQEPRVIRPGPEHNRHARRLREAMQAEMERAYMRIPGATKKSIGKELTSLAYAAWHEGLLTDRQLKLLGGVS